MTLTDKEARFLTALAREQNQTGCRGPAHDLLRAHAYPDAPRNGPGSLAFSYEAVPLTGLLLRDFADLAQIDEFLRHGERIAQPEWPWADAAEYRARLEEARGERTNGAARWAAAEQAVRDLTGYDSEADQEQRELDRGQHRTSPPGVRGDVNCIATAPEKPSRVGTPGAPMTIIEAIKEVMRRQGAAMTVSEIYDAIIAADLYTFHADNPQHIVSNQIRRHCVGLDFPSSSQTKHFTIRDDNKYYFLAKPRRNPKAPRRNLADAPDRLLSDLKALHHRYQDELKKRILLEIRAIEPENFEHFSRRLLQTYGFTDLAVTPYSKDGGVDGYGRLKVGLAYLNVAFQCKRWNKNTVGRPEIDKFRGAIQGQYEQGLLFTTGSFAAGAEAASFRPGAVPIVLIDGPAIVEMMIEKQFGIQVESLPIYSYALDLALSDEE